MIRRKCKLNYKVVYPQLTDRRVLDVLRKSDRKMEYMEYDLKVNRWVVDPKSKQRICLPSREVSLDQLIETGYEFADVKTNVEESVDFNDLVERLHVALASLIDRDRHIIKNIYFD